MISQAFRLPLGGLIDRSQTIGFTFDGQRLTGHPGDTLASALLANGVRIVARSFKYHRPRGIFAAGAEEPNALLTLGSGNRQEPNLRATQVELFDGLEATSQNCWPSLRVDLGSVLGLFGRVIPAGFYYKTFMWPRSLWPTYEQFIRRAAGMGRCASDSDPDGYAHHNMSVEVLVVGSGPAGLAAARAAATESVRVLLVEQDHVLGGSLLSTRTMVEGRPGPDWVAATVAELAYRSNVTLLPRAVAFGCYDDGLVGVAERVADHTPFPRAGQPRQRLWKVRAQRIVLAAGAIERPIVFPGNDRPGVMLASAARTYLNRFGVVAGRRALVFTNNDSAYAVASELTAAGVEVVALVDVRRHLDPSHQAQLNCTEWLPGHAVVAALGARQVTGVVVAPLDVDGTPKGRERRIACDLLCVSGGWSPTAHLHSIAGGGLAFEETIGAFVPDRPARNLVVVGAAKGSFRLADHLDEGRRAGIAAAAGNAPSSHAVADFRNSVVAAAYWAAPATQRGKAFVDLQTDVTAADVRLAVREGYVGVEHLKRYTTLGMGTDQGRTSNVAGIGELAQNLNRTASSLGRTTFRPPYTPVTLGTFAGLETGPRVAPVRLTPMHDWHVANGAFMGPAGLWLRPLYYRRDGEGIQEAIGREARGVREAVGLTDVSTLGKIEVQGPDACTLLERVYANDIGRLAVGRCRYGLMLREDGLLFDDGTVARLGGTRYVLTSTTSHAEVVLRHLERYHQVSWPELRVRILDVTEQWAAMAVAGPSARHVLERVCAGFDLSSVGLPHMGLAEGMVAGVPSRIFRISFSGELSFEVNVPAGAGQQIWEALLAAGQDHRIAPYGLEAMATLRIEKGYPAGSEINGRVTADDLGLGKFLRRDKDYIGARSLGRIALNEAGRRQLVGLISQDGRTPVPRGAQIVADPTRPTPNLSLGEVTSRCVSPVLGKPVALALVSGGRTRHGERLFASSPLAGVTIPVVVRDPVFVDPQGERLDG